MIVIIKEWKMKGSSIDRDEEVHSHLVLIQQKKGIGLKTNFLFLSHAAYEQIRNKNKGSNDILSWGKKGSKHYETNYEASNRQINQHEIDYNQNKQKEYNKYSSTIIIILSYLSQKANNTPEKVTNTRSRIQQSTENPITGSSQKAYGVMPSYQKFENNKDEIKYLENELLDLNQNRKKVEKCNLFQPKAGK